MNGSTLRFVEVQHFRQWWVWLAVIGAAALLLGTCTYGLYVQLVLGRPWGDNPMSDTWLIVTAILVFVFDLALLALAATMHLRTEVRTDGLYTGFFPGFCALHLPFHRLPLADVRGVEAVTYSPIMEYGGWGVLHRALRGRGKAYLVSGDRGVQLTHATGRHVLIGSQRPDELAAAIESLRQSGTGS